MLKLESAPALTNDHKVRESAPKFAAKLDKERISMLFHSVGVPVSIVFVPDNDFAIHDLLRCVSWLAIYIDPL